MQRAVLGLILATLSGSTLSAQAQEQAATLPRFAELDWGVARKAVSARMRELEFTRVFTSADRETYTGTWLGYNTTADIEFGKDRLARVALFMRPGEEDAGSIDPLWKLLAGALRGRYGEPSMDVASPPLGPLLQWKRAHSTGEYILLVSAHTMNGERGIGIVFISPFAKDIPKRKQLL